MSPCHQLAASHVCVTRATKSGPRCYLAQGVIVIVTIMVIVMAIVIVIDSNGNSNRKR